VVKVVVESLAIPVKAFGEVGMIAFVEFTMATAASASMPPPGAFNSDLQDNQYFISQNKIHGNQTTIGAHSNTVICTSYIRENNLLHYHHRTTQKAKQ